MEVDSRFRRKCPLRRGGRGTVHLAGQAQNPSPSLLLAFVGEGESQRLTRSPIENRERVPDVKGWRR